MRIKVNLLTELEKTEIPINYQHELGSAIYHSVSNGRKSFATWLHNKGWGDGNKRFKFFNFSLLHIDKFQIKDNKILIYNDSLYFKFSTLMPEILNLLVEGLFNETYIAIGNRSNQVRFKVESIEVLPSIAFSEIMVYQLETPCVISYRTEKGTSYINPDSTKYNYSELFIKNLVSKYLVLQYESPNGHEDLVSSLIKKCKFELLTKPRSKLITIKEGSMEETKVRGFIYSFKLTAPIELHRVGVYSGFGEKNSMGFGWCEVVG